MLLEMKEDNKETKLKLEHLEKQNQKLLSIKTNNEQLGEVLNTEYSNVKKLIQYVNNNLSEEDVLMLDYLYKDNSYYSYRELFGELRPHYLKGLHNSKAISVATSVSRTINSVYKSLTGGELTPMVEHSGKSKIFHFSKKQSIFLLWYSDMKAMSYGVYKKVKKEDINSNAAEILELDLNDWTHKETLESLI
jgi:hypothetical protein